MTLFFAYALTGCERASDSEAPEADAAASSEPVGDYTIVPETGEVRATHTDTAGVTTSLRAGDTIKAELPAPFTVYPDAAVSYGTQVQRGDGTSATIEFDTPDSVNDVVAFYRKQAADAQITPNVEVTGGDTTTLAGTNRRGGTSFALQATRGQNGTRGLLSVESGFE